MKTPQSMQDELHRWNNGSGIDLETWVGCSGNFSLAVGYVSLFNPHFAEAEDYIFQIDKDEETVEACLASIRQWERQKDSHPFKTEWLVNHFHIEDIHYLGCEDIAADKLMVIGNALKEIYQAKLAYQFPDRACEVEFYLPDDKENYHEYQLSFWQKKHRLDFENKT